MNILGLNAYHGDSAACIVKDGILINAIEEERIRRIKHWAGLPTEATKWCLKDAGLSIEDIDFIAISRDPSAHLYKKIVRVIKTPSSIPYLFNRLSNTIKIKDIKEQLAKDLDVKVSQIKAKVKNIEHHKAHLGSSFLVSPFNSAACISIDGFGDSLSTMRALGNEAKIQMIDSVEFPHSLGIFYTAMTQFLGFPNYGDEYKVMGLSAYGKPILAEKLRDIVILKSNGLFEINCSYFLHDKEGVEMLWENGSPSISRIFSDKLIEALGSPRNKTDEINQFHKDLSASVQFIYEEAFLHILNDTYEKTRTNNLCLAGGCIQNSLANGKVLSKTKFTDLYIPPAAYDAGTAIGAAMVTWYKESGSKRNFVMNSPYCGPLFKSNEIKQVLESYTTELKNYKIKSVNSEYELCVHTAKEIAAGKIIGWFQGRTELGPRALGNRSILADPRKKDMKEILNARIKRRESFRPFAPSILEEKCYEWFESKEKVPFMEKVYSIRKDRRNLIPTVCHEDGTGRLQTVSRETNPRYHLLIKCFEEITEIPIILNTSFNDNEPIVNTPKDAIECFLKTKMDLLVMGDFLITKDIK